MVHHHVIYCRNSITATLRMTKITIKMGFVWDKKSTDWILIMRPWYFIDDSWVHPCPLPSLMHPFESNTYFQHYTHGNLGIKENHLTTVFMFISQGGCQTLLQQIHNFINPIMQCYQRITYIGGGRTSCPVSGGLREARPQNVFWRIIT